MGCGASKSSDEMIFAPKSARGAQSHRSFKQSYDIKERNRRRSEEDDDSTSSDSDDSGDDSDDGSVGSAALVDRDAYATPQMDRLWQVKVEVLQGGHHSRMPVEDFSKQLGISQRDVYKALDLFGDLSDTTGQLEHAKIGKMIGWAPGKNKILERIIDCFDEDRNGWMDFVEFLVLTRMFHGHFKSLDKSRFWWWVALYTDENSILNHNQDTNIVDRDKAEALMAKEAHGSDRDGVARVPTQTLERFLRDAMVSMGQLRSGDKSAFQGTEFISNPAPSKVLNKVRAAMQQAGIKHEKMVFHQFHDLIYKGHKQFSIVLDTIFMALQRVLLSGHAPDNPGKLHLMKLRAYFYGKVEEYLDLEEEYETENPQETVSRRAPSQWQHEDLSAPPSARSVRSHRSGKG
eukprot:CAMPEP_0181310230 /NCGR_PEP_ID=MMETSP1101-20121128/12473_1 /TAXON_ID=46948 /ORGANISM="Rhodomonas abbreviata, Strain Caron Lab Isolate" /LENGTH=402 /DNA_ID=CAMNT_0023416841 /DNA_START=194 /DNA_END=1398 /DNA_ORIENTATION=+